MGYRFEAGRICRMPTHFGPASGPRQMPDGMPADPASNPRRLSVAARFLTGAARLEAHLPEGFTLSGEPVVTVEFHYLTGIDWLAGRGYTMVQVSWPASFAGREDKASGRFLAVIWENLADPVITGRDEIGHPKLYADIPPPRMWDGAHLCSAGWLGFRFLDIEVSGLRDISPDAPPPDDILMLKYVPRTGAWGEADLYQVTLTPGKDPDRTVEHRQTGTGRVQFHPAAWADLPTMDHVVNALAGLPVYEPRGGTVVHSRGGKSHRDQRILR